MPLKPLRSGEYPEGEKPLCRSLTLVFSCRSRASPEMVAVAISERDEGPSRAGLAAERGHRAPDAHRSAVRGTQGPGAHRDPALLPMDVLPPLCSIGNLGKL